MKQWGEVILFNDLGQGWRFSNDADLYIAFSESFKSDEFSVKITDVLGVTYSKQITYAGDFINIQRQDLESHLNVDRGLKRVTLMYRLSNVPKVVYLNNSLLDCPPDGYAEDELPIPLHSIDAIVTEL